MTSPKIYCIGDSHISVFLGRDMLSAVYPESTEPYMPCFKVYRIGPITAYNVNNPDSSTGAKMKIDAIVKDEIPKASNIVFCIGEIDLRVHVLKQVKNQNKELTAICSEIIERYFSLLKTYKELGHRIIIMSAPPSSYGQNDDPEYPKFGTETERNLATFEYNKQLKAKSSVLGFSFIDIFTEYVNDDNTTKRGCLWDDVHPASLVLKTIVRQLNKLGSFDLQIPLQWHAKQFIKNTYRIYDRISQKNMA